MLIKAAYNSLTLVSCWPQTYPAHANSADRRGFCEFTDLSGSWFVFSTVMILHVSFWTDRSGQTL